jgi:hypothetical protein
MMATTLTSIHNKTTKVKRLKENRFSVFLLSRFCFVVGLFFYAFDKLRKFFISKNLFIIFKLNIIKSFYYIKRDFTTILVAL